MEQKGSQCEKEGIATGANGNVMRAKVIAWIGKSIALIAEGIATGAAESPPSCESVPTKPTATDRRNELA